MQFIRTVDGDWAKPLTLDDLMAVLIQLPQGTTYQLVCGNTMKGVYSLGTIDTFIDVTGIPELTEIQSQTGSPFILGGNLPISDCIRDMLKDCTVSACDDISCFWLSAAVASSLGSRDSNQHRKERNRK